MPVNTSASGTANESAPDVIDPLKLQKIVEVFNEKTIEWGPFNGSPIVLATKKGKVTLKLKNQSGNVKAIVKLRSAGSKEIKLLDETIGSGMDPSLIDFANLSEPLAAGEYELIAYAFTGQPPATEPTIARLVIPLGPSQDRTPFKALQYIQGSFLEPISAELDPARPTQRILIFCRRNL